MATHLLLRAVVEQMLIYLCGGLDVLTRSHLMRCLHYNRTRWCAPSRAALLTGMYPQHTGVYWFSGAGYALPSKFQLIPEMLEAAGYTSHAIGKYGHNRSYLRFPCLRFAWSVHYSTGHPTPNGR
jgi:hypothetical protein